MYSGSFVSEGSSPGSMHIRHHYSLTPHLNTTLRRICPPASNSNKDMPENSTRLPVGGCSLM
jgi:hypothetical protein